MLVLQDADTTRACDFGPRKESTMNIPVTGSVLYDCVLIVIVLIIGTALALKADNKFGWLIVVLSIVWAVMIMKAVTS